MRCRRRVRPALVDFSEQGVRDIFLFDGKRLPAGIQAKEMHLDSHSLTCLYTTEEIRDAIQTATPFAYAGNGFRGRC